MPVALATAVIVAFVASARVLGDHDSEPPTATEASTSLPPAPSTSDAPTPDLPSPAEVAVELSKHKWVQLPAEENSGIPAPWLYVEMDGHLNGFDGCGPVTAFVTISDRGLIETIRRSARSQCDPRRSEAITDAWATVDAVAGIARVHLRPLNGQPRASFVAVNELPLATRADLVGAWNVTDGSRMTLDAAGAAIVTGGWTTSWALETGVLRIAATECHGDDSMDASAPIGQPICLGGLVATVRRYGDALLLEVGAGYFWLQRAAVSPAAVAG